MDQLSICDIKLQKVAVPLKEPFIISLGPLYSADNVVVTITTQEGIVGWGECSPFMTINGESADTCLIVGEYFKKVWLGKNPIEIEVRMNELDQVIYGNNSIKSAFDMALYDIAAQHAGVPLYKFLGGKKDKEIATDFTVSVDDAAKMASDALKLKNAGFPVIKVKLGKNGQKDVERIRGIREAVGYEIPIRVDANQGWNLQEAIETLNALAPFNIQHCEEPLPRWAFMQLPELRKQSPIPIMCDESCCDPNDLKRLIDLNACDRINIKLGKSGGILKALKMIQMAEKAGVPIQLGAFLESRIAMTAFAHLALCSDAIVYYDFDTALMFSEDPVEGGIRYKENGVIDVPDVPGIGARLGIV